ncbi:uncharacterized protein V3H82_022030 [Fundulus diaphanus]
MYRTNCFLFLSGNHKVICDISQLCSNKSAYYWMKMRTEQTTTPESQIQTLVSTAFNCNRASGKATHGAAHFNKFCEAIGQLQVVNVSCRAENAQSSQSVCDVLLLLSHAVSTYDLQCVGEAAMQNVEKSLKPIIIGNIERVALRNLCEDVLPSSGGFVRCVSPVSLEEICKSNRTTNVTCSVLGESSEAAPQDATNSCNRTDGATLLQLLCVL